MTETLPAKAPAEVLDYAIDASDLLGEGETLLSVSSSITVSGATKDGEAFTETGVTVWISEGTAGTPIKIVALLKTSGGRTFQRSYIIPYGEPVSLEQARAQCRILDDTSEDALLAGYIRAARAWVEGHTGHILAPREIVETRDSFGRYVRLHHWPVTSNPGIEYQDAEGETQTLADARYLLARRPARIYPAIGSQWPATACPGEVTITYQAGHADPMVTAPELIQAMLLLIGHWFAVRETSEIPAGVESLCRDYRMPSV